MRVGNNNDCKHKTSIQGYGADDVHGDAQRAMGARLKKMLPLMHSEQAQAFDYQGACQY